MPKKQQIAIKNDRWPKEFLEGRMASLVDQLSKHEGWNRRAVENLRTSEHISSSGCIDDSNTADCAQIFADTEVDRISTKCSAQIISQVRNALSLISDDLKSQDKHRYGQCGQCGTAIGSARLEAIPWADLCIKCQEQQEETNGFKNNGHNRGILVPTMEKLRQP